MEGKGTSHRTVTDAPNVDLQQQECPSNVARNKNTSKCCRGGAGGVKTTPSPTKRLENLKRIV